MMCDECGIRNANFHLTTIVGGEKKEKNLCAVCMEKYKKQLPNLDLTNLAGLLGGMLGAVKKSGFDDDGPEYDLTCPRCGMTYAQFRKTGLLGCAHCYEEFRVPIEKVLSRIHGNTQHAGRVPGGAAGDMTLKREIDTLKQQLVKAIAEEEYEQAAQMRDQIRALNAKLETKRMEEKQNEQ